MFHIFPNGFNRGTLNPLTVIVQKVLGANPFDLVTTTIIVARAAPCEHGFGFKAFEVHIIRIMVYWGL